MDNKKQKISPMAEDLAKVMKFAKSFAKKAENGDGLGLSQEQRIEYRKKLKENPEVKNKLEELREKMSGFGELIKKANGHGADH